MTDAQPPIEDSPLHESKPQLIIPQLKPFYDFVEPLSWLMIRLTAGLMLLPHGIPKLMAGIEAAEPLAVVLIFLETIGGLCVALGLFTRFFAAAIAIEMMVIAYHYLPKFGWTGPGYEYPLMWGFIMVAIALRGGGPFSIDQRLGKEL